MATWVAPAALATAVLGGLAFLRHRSLTPAPGDVVSVPPGALLGGVQLPALIPPNAQVAVQLDQNQPGAPSQWHGQIVGFVDAATDQVFRPNAPITLGPAVFARKDVTGLYRGNPARRVT